MSEKASVKTTVPCQFCRALNRVDIARYRDGPKCGECHKPILIDRPLKVEEDEFDATVLKAAVPVLVDFYAEWCKPCRVMAPVVDEIAQANVGRLLVVKVDTDRAPRVAQQYNIRSIPFFARFENEQPVKTVVGGVGPEGLADLAA